MDFYSIVIIIAVVLLILSLTAIGIIVTQSNSAAVFPASQNSCPDYWTSEGKRCVSTNDMNIGILVDKAYTPTDKLCENYRWTFDNKISWDGVSNTNQCT